jgi:molybdopterin-guanine dinucleotide biosynthesis protein A
MQSPVSTDRRFPTIAFNMVTEIQPIVLVGGRSSRFGRDKLREAWRGSEGGEWLVDQSRLALARALGGAVWAVGDCHPDVAARFDRHLADQTPGAGPIAGIVAGLLAAARSVFVLPGDLSTMTAEAVGEICRAAATSPHADAVVAATPDDGCKLEPCVGIYRPSILPLLQSALSAYASDSANAVAQNVKTPALHRLLAGASVVTVALDRALLRNVNQPAEL